LGLDPPQYRVAHIAAGGDAGQLARRPVVTERFALAGIELLARRTKSAGRWRPMRIAKAAMVRTVA
jgi:hypothetical protein